MEFIIIDEQDHSQDRLLKHLVNESRKTNQILQEIKHAMSTALPGLAALQQFATDFATVVNNLTDAVNAAAAALANSGASSEDPAVLDAVNTLKSQLATAQTDIQNLSATTPASPAPTV